MRVLQEWVLIKRSVYCLQETWSKRWCLWAQTDELSWQRWLSRGWGVRASGGRQSQLSTSISQSGIHELSGKSKRKGVNVVSRLWVFLSRLAHTLLAHTPDVVEGKGTHLSVEQSQIKPLAQSRLESFDSCSIWEQLQDNWNQKTQNVTQFPWWKEQGIEFGWPVAPVKLSISPYYGRLHAPTLCMISNFY